MKRNINSLKTNKSSIIARRRAFKEHLRIDTRNIAKALDIKSINIDFKEQKSIKDSFSKNLINLDKNTVNLDLLKSILESWHKFIPNHNSYNDFMHSTKGGMDYMMLEVSKIMEDVNNRNRNMMLDVHALVVAFWVSVAAGVVVYAGAELLEYALSEEEHNPQETWTLDDLDGDWILNINDWDDDGDGTSDDTDQYPYDHTMSCFPPIFWNDILSGVSMNYDVGVTFYMENDIVTYASINILGVTYNLSFNF